MKYFMQRYKKIFNKKIEKSATKPELKAMQDKIVKLQIYDSSLFIGQSYFINDGSQIVLIFQPIVKWKHFQNTLDKIVE